MFKSNDKMKRNTEDLEINTVIAEGISIEGDLVGKDSIRIDGKVTGNIRIAKGLVIGESGHVEGDIQCESIITFGNIIGNIDCQSLKLKNSGTITGDILVELLAVDLGGKVNGAVQMKPQESITKKRKDNKDSE